MTVGGLQSTWREVEDSSMFSADAIADHLRYLEALGRSDETIKNARNSLTRWDRQLPMGILTALPEEIEGLLAAEDVAGTRATYYDTLVRFYRWLAHTERIDFDPTAGMRRPRVPRRAPRPATDRQVEVACDAADPWRLHCRLAAFAGLRCCEIARLDRDDITDPDGPGMLLRGKGGHERLVPTPPEVWELVEPMPGGLITRADPQWVSGATNEHLRKALGLRVTMHRFRVWYATTALAAGADLRTVQELLGHSDIGSTVVYTAVTDRAKRDAVARMPRLGRITR